MLTFLLVITLLFSGCQKSSPPSEKTPINTNTAPAKAPSQAPEEKPVEEKPVEEKSPTPTVDLLRSVDASVAVSSVYKERVELAGRLVDGDMETAWNSRSGDLNGAWIGIQLPTDVTVESIGLTVGYNKVKKEKDLFTGNHRIKKVRVVREGKDLGVFSLDPEKREIQYISVEGQGGRYRIEVVEVFPGTRSKWREICVSELRVMGHAKSPSATQGPPKVTVGTRPESTSDTENKSLKDPLVASLAVEIDKRFRENPSVSAKVEYLGQVSNESGTFVAFKGAVDIDSGLTPEFVTLILATPRKGGHDYLVIQLGETLYMAGSADVAKLESFENFRFESGVVRADLSVITRYAEYDTCDDCQGRREYSHYRDGYVLTCGKQTWFERPFEECILTQTSCEIAEKGVETDENGDTAPLDPNPLDRLYKFSLAVVDKSRVKIRLVSGEANPDHESRAGEFNFTELPGERSFSLDEFIEDVGVE